MIKFKDYVKNLQKILDSHPESGEYVVVYSHDDEGNEYQTVMSNPDLVYVDNLNENSCRDLQFSMEKEIAGEFNAVIIN